MSTNPYDAPKADLQDGLGSSQEQAPAMWNPNAAASWCLLFSVAFGAFLHMKNWQALGEPEKAKASKNWFIAGLCGYLVSIAAALFSGPDGGFVLLIRLGFFVLLLSWYFISAKPQAAYVESRFGQNYPHKGWGAPISIGVGALFGFFVLAAVVEIVRGILFGRF